MGMEVEACFPLVADTVSIKRDVEDLGVHCYRWHVGEGAVPETWGDVAQQMEEASALFRRSRPDGVLAALPWPDSALGFIQACARHKMAGLIVSQLCPHVVSIPDELRRLCRDAAASHLAWVAVSEHNRSFVSATFGVPIESVLVVNEGIRIDSRWAHLSKAQHRKIATETRREFELADTDRLVITVGRLTGQKDYWLLLSTIPELTQEFPDIRFLWVGTGDQELQLRSAVRAGNLEGKVLFAGFRTDVPRLLAASDLFVLPSLYEGAPFSVLEAMAYGCPIVATAAGGTGELVHHQEHALLSPPGDRVSLLKSLRWALMNSSAMARFARAAKLRVGNFDATRMYGETFRHLQNEIARA
jgi:glycosyltransferase involved in cell wall biosynthesis